MRVLYVHAHPDDETIATGASIALLGAEGHDVHVLTCTLGEQGEVIPPELVHLGADHDDDLGRHRIGELSAALEVLGATGHILGADRRRFSRYRDSGMAGSPSAARPDAFVNADPGEVIALMRATIAEIHPDIVVTYESRGGYGHPDHIQAHRVVCAAIATMATPPHTYAVFTPIPWAVADRAWVQAHVEEAGIGIPAQGDPFPESVLPEDLIAIVHEGGDARHGQALALHEHATQVRVFDGWFTLSNNIAQRLSGREAWARLDVRTGLLQSREAKT
ncbi:MAG: N-acetyl-1-D-myo-inositol-2-amino-2-deoxy-alpha-D-glucopyranoside deacetylase [Tetrasphaera sp.]